MKEIEEFKNLNGNITYSAKELIGGLHVKIDRILERLTEGDKRFSRIETTTKWHSKLICGLYTIWGAILMSLLAGINYFKRIFGG